MIKFIISFSLSSYSRIDNCQLRRTHNHFFPLSSPPAGTQSRPVQIHILECLVGPTRMTSPDFLMSLMRALTRDPLMSNLFMIVPTVMIFILAICCFIFFSSFLMINTSLMLVSFLLPPPDQDFFFFELDAALAMSPC